MRERLLSAARTTFATTGYDASVHDICEAAGVGIGTFYHEFPDKADLMRALMNEEHAHRVRAFDGLTADHANTAAEEVVRVLSGSNPPLLRAMIEACETDPGLRNFSVDLRRESRTRLAGALERVRSARDTRRPALDSTTAAAAVLALGDTGLARDGFAPLENVVRVLAFAETIGRRVRA